MHSLSILSSLSGHAPYPYQQPGPAYPPAPPSQPQQGQVIMAGTQPAQDNSSELPAALLYAGAFGGGYYYGGGTLLAAAALSGIRLSVLARIYHTCG